MKIKAPKLIFSLLLLLIGSPVLAAPILLDGTSLSSYGISSSTKGKALEDILNANVFNPAGITLEVAAHTGGTSAVDDFTIEGPGLTVIGGAGFILRFDSAVSEVTIRFGNYKDDFNRALYAFGSAIDYTRGPAPGSQHYQGNFNGWTEPLSSAVDLATGTVTSSGPLELTVSDPGGILSVYANTQKFLTSWEAIDVTVASSVPEPSSFLLLLLGLTSIRMRKWGH